MDITLLAQACALLLSSFLPLVPLFKLTCCSYSVVLGREVVLFQSFINRCVQDPSSAYIFFFREFTEAYTMHFFMLYSYEGAHLIDESSRVLLHTGHTMDHSAVRPIPSCAPSHTSRHSARVCSRPSDCFSLGRGMLYVSTSTTVV